MRGWHVLSWIGPLLTVFGRFVSGAARAYAGDTPVGGLQWGCCTSWFQFMPGMIKVTHGETGCSGVSAH